MKRTWSLTIANSPRSSLKASLENWSNCRTSKTTKMAIWSSLSTAFRNQADTRTTHTRCLSRLWRTTPAWASVLPTLRANSPTPLTATLPSNPVGLRPRTRRWSRRRTTTEYSMNRRLIIHTGRGWTTCFPASLIPWHSAASGRCFARRTRSSSWLIKSSLMSL